jgi:hypothetical protein
MASPATAVSPSGWPGANTLGEGEGEGGVGVGVGEDVTSNVTVAGADAANPVRAAAIAWTVHSPSSANDRTPVLGVIWQSAAPGLVTE